MRKIGISDIEDIALGAALLGAGGGGDPYIGKLLAIGAVKECGEVSLIDVDELSDDDVVVPVASVGAPTILTEKGVGSNEFTKLIDMVGSYYGKKITAIMPIEGWRREFHAAHCRGSAPGPSHGRRRRHGPRVPRNSNGHVHHWRRVGKPYALH